MVRFLKMVVHLDRDSRDCQSGVNLSGRDRAECCCTTTTKGCDYVLWHHLEVSVCQLFQQFMVEYIC